MQRLSIFVLLLFVASGAQAADTSENLVRVQPREIQDLLANPGIGWQTFGRFADEDPNLQGLPSSNAYFRWYWREIEPREGEIDFAKFDNALQRARKAGQQFSFRVMTAGTSRDYDYSPAWLREMGLPGFEYTYNNDSRKRWVPDFNDPRVLERHLRLIRALGERYDGHRDLALVDIGSVGLWGEWHMSGTNVEMPSTATQMAIIDAYLKSFRKTPLAMLIGDFDGLKYATQNGAGWRADCLGDMGGFSKNWNHMRDMYPPQIERAGIADAWKRAPVAFESCWDMRKWVEEGWDVQRIFDWALAQHASLVNNKSQPIPEGARPLVESFLRLLGYRFVARSIEHAAAVKPGGSLEVRIAWENIGVAPCYYDYRPAIALVDQSGKRRAISVSDRSVREWLPGKHEQVERVAIPADLAAGEYDLQLAIVRGDDKEPVVKLAVEGRRADGWYGVSRVRVE